MKKIYGMLTPLLISISIVVIAVVVALVVSSTSSDGWASLGAVIFVFLLGGLGLLIHLIVSIFMYTKRQNEYWLYVLYGYVGLIGFSVLISISISAYNYMIG